MPIATYMVNFQLTEISHNAENMSSASFLMLDDNSNSPGKLSWCGSECTRHEFTVTSDVAQYLFVTFHTWDRRSLGESCEGKSAAHFYAV